MGLWLSYSGYSQYRKCPKEYFLKRVKKLKPPIDDSKHNAIIGTVVQHVFEDFYNKELWRRGAQVSATLLALGEEYFWKYLETEYVDFNAPRCRFASAHEVLDEIFEMIPKVLQGIKRERFLGPKAQSEIDIKVRFGQSDFLCGYIDFIIRKQDGTILLLDGKASRHHDKYIDDTQLYFYALMFYLRYKRLPDKLGFFYYHFADDPEKAMGWLPVDKARIKALRIDIEDVMYEIKKKQFEAKPSSKACMWCPWESVCEERLAKKRSGSKTKKKKTAPLDIDFKGKSKVIIGFD